MHTLLDGRLSPGYGKTGRMAGTGQGGRFSLSGRYCAIEKGTEGEIKDCTWLREISSCSYLTVMHGPAWVLLSKTNKPLFTPLHISEKT